MNLKRILPILIVLVAVPFFMMAQVTTSSITGFVKSASGQPVEGATITAIHVPTGTQYATVSQKNGNFTIPNTRIGGPYTIKAESVGFASQTIEGVTLLLGQAYNAQFVLSNQATVLSEITINALGRPTTIKTGTTTNINSRQLATLPTISRSVTDFTRLTPQANGTSFAGRDGRFNNIQVDGANLNNNFGLSSDPLPGGGSSPISFETFDEISVNIAPFDVRQSGFTGAGLNITTKSGTNTFHGSVYGYYRNQSFNGKHAGKVDVTTPTSTNKSYGFTLGGPIIKNKLFFFVNAEKENNQVPNSVQYIPTGSTASGIVSAAPIDSLNKFRDFLKSQYNYNAGVYDNRPNYVTQNTKLLGKIDWNISERHKLTIKYSNFKGSDQSPLNGSSVPNSGAGGFYIEGQPNINDPFKWPTRLPNNRNSSQSIGFSNSDYGTNHWVQEGTIELNSNFNSQWSNQLLLAYTHDQDTRFSPGGFFPTVEIFNGDGTVTGVTAGRNYMSAGTDPFTRNNDVVNNIASITDNLTHFVGRHTLVAGVNYEYQKVGNAFMGGSESLYMYNTLNDFITGAPPAYFSYTYSLVPGQAKVFSANLKVGQLGVYLQDQVAINSNFTLTYGIRGDIPTYLQQPINNPAISALQFPNKDGVMMNYSTGHWPKSKLLLSPRAGFRWKVPDEKGLVLRGGLGIFTGKLPFVYLTNMPTNSGMYQTGTVINNPTTLATMHFNPDPDGWKSLFPTTVSATAPGSFVLIDPNFKFPQVFRTNFGIDKQLGNGFTASVDLLYTKDINDVIMRNANLIAPSGQLSGLDNRPYYPSTQTGAAKFVNPSVGSVIVLENNKKGYSFAGTAQISKSFAKGFYGSVAYTYTLATEVTSNPGSQATSTWQSLANVGTPNNIELYSSAYSIPHRVVATLSYRLEYAQHMATTLSMFYQGSSFDKFSYVVGGDLNGDGNNASDLMFVYAKGSDVPFVNFMAGTTVKYTVAQQQAAYDQFVNNSPYLKHRKGQFAERNSALYPWYNRLDASLLQDFYAKVGGQRHNIQFSVTVLNFLNMINRNWGVQDFYTVNKPLTLKGIVNGAPTYTLAEYQGSLVNQAFVKSTSATTTWGMQLGLKYFF